MAFMTIQRKTVITVCSLVVLLGCTSVALMSRVHFLARRQAEAQVLIGRLEAGALWQRHIAETLYEPVHFDLINTMSTGSKASLTRDLFDDECKQCSISNNPVLNAGFDESTAALPSLIDLKQSYIHTSPLTKFTLVVFFSPSDCPACLTESQVWADLAEKKDRLHLDVFAVVDRCTGDEAAQFMRQKQLLFPALHDRASVLRALYQVTVTPQSLLLTREGKVLLLGGPAKTPEAQQVFEHAVISAISSHVEP